MGTRMGPFFMVLSGSIWVVYPCLNSSISGGFAGLPAATKGVSDPLGTPSCQHTSRILAWVAVGCGTSAIRRPCLKRTIQAILAFNLTSGNVARAP